METREWFLSVLIDTNLLNQFKNYVRVKMYQFKNIDRGSMYRILIISILWKILKQTLQQMSIDTEIADQNIERGREIFDYRL